MSSRPLLTMPWPFIYDSHNTMVNRKRQQIIQYAKLCEQKPGLCKISIDLNNINTDQPSHLRMYLQDAQSICKDAHDFFASLNYNVQYAFNNNDKMTCTLTFDNKK